MPLRVLVVVLAGCAAIGTYGLATRRLERRGVRWPWSRTASFYAGTLLAAGMMAAPVPDRFSGRVLEHLLLGMAAPCLLVLGRPVTLALRARHPVSRAVRVALRSPAGAVLCHPLVAAAVFAAGPWLLWLTPLYELEESSPVVHQVVHLHLLLSGALLALGVLGLEPTRWRGAHGLRMLAAAVLLPVHTLLGLVLLSAGTPWLNEDMGRTAGLADQRFGAGLVWVAGDALATVALLVVGLQWSRREPRRLDVGAAEPVARAATG